MSANTLRYGLILAAALWTLSLFSPAITFVFDVEPKLFPGWKVLGSGWTSIFSLQTGWLANLAFWVLVFALLALSPSTRMVRSWAIALLLFSVHTTDLFVRPDFYDVQSIHGGYYLWIAANVGLAGLAIAFTRKRTVTAQ